MKEGAPLMIECFATHGGRLDLAGAAFPHVRRWIDLSTGIAPWPYPFAMAETRDATAMLARLPAKSDIAALEAAAAADFGIDPRTVVAVPGTDLALRLLGVILGGNAAAIAPGYAGHRQMWGDRTVTLTGQDGFAALAERHDALVLARPNNPDGWVADCAMLEAAARALAARGGYLVVDEAFVDATPDASLAGRGWPGLILLRSFGKFHGLAGLRLGFVLAPAPVGDRLRHLIGDWPISGPAIAAGLSAYGDERWALAQRARLLTAVTRLATMLHGHGLHICGETRFFVLVDETQRDALFHHLGRHGILTRPFTNQANWLRIGLPRDEEDWAQLAAALAAWRGQ